MPASITNEAVAELGLRSGLDAVAVIKASDVMIGVGWHLIAARCWLVCQQRSSRRHTHRRR